ncbi:hypothetical protein BC832DRAFT_275680 [Gaertneriomyces semiglobifer]|nr:hypothetical protein BC832DRAFT_275680 [Gaertneriomyces semiglobifer]
MDLGNEAENTQDEETAKDVAEGASENTVDATTTVTDTVVDDATVTERREETVEQNKDDVVQTADEDQQQAADTTVGDVINSSRDNTDIAEAGEAGGDIKEENVSSQDAEAGTNGDQPGNVADQEAGETHDVSPPEDENAIAQRDIDRTDTIPAEAADGDHLTATLDSTNISLLSDSQRDIHGSSSFSAENAYVYEPTDPDSLTAHADNFTILPPTTVTISSPPLPPSNFVFVNADYEKDHDEDIVEIVTRMSPDMRATDYATTISRSKDSDKQGEDEDESLMEIDVPLLSLGRGVPILRPGSPTTITSKTPEGEGSKLEETEGASAQEEAEKPEAVPEIVAFDREEWISMIKSALETKDRLAKRNESLQNRAAEWFRRKRNEDTAPASTPAAESQPTSDRYLSTLGQISNLLSHRAHLQSNHAVQQSEYLEKLSHLQADHAAKAAEYTDYRTQVGTTSVHSFTGKPLSATVIEDLTNTDAKKDDEVRSVRLENIRLRNSVRRNESLLKTREELGEGLHLIDFEQLKIENLALCEKIEERGGELSRLRRRICEVGVVLGHVKEKMWFMESEVATLSATLQQLSEELSSLRTPLPPLKSALQHLRSLNTELKQRNGLLGNTELLRDYEVRVDEVDQLQARINELQALWKSIRKEGKVIERRVAKAEYVSGGQGREIEW